MNSIKPFGLSGLLFLTLPALVCLPTSDRGDGLPDDSAGPAEGFPPEVILNDHSRIMFKLANQTVETSVDTHLYMEALRQARALCEAQ